MKVWRRRRQCTAAAAWRRTAAPGRTRLQTAALTALQQLCDLGQLASSFAPAGPGTRKIEPPELSAARDGRCAAARAPV
eukprot:188453-Chlamydomonas_euryale.AAC.1